MKKFRNKISIAIGTAALAVGLIAVPVLANTSQNPGYSNGTRMMSNQGSLQGKSMTGNQGSMSGIGMTGNQGSMQGSNMTGNQGSTRGSGMVGNQGTMQGKSMISAFMQEMSRLSGAFRQFVGSHFNR